MENLIILIGMSGVGKSYHASRLSKKSGYKLFSIDDLIANSLGEGNVRDIASWLGYPYSFSYKVNSKKYLLLEERFTKEAIDYAETHKDEKVVIDTTGSLVHLSPRLQNKIKESGRVIFLDVDATKLNGMIRLYVNDPKPVIWGDLANHFSEKNYLSDLKKLYPQLLRKRREIYRLLATVTVPYKTHKQKGWSVRYTLEDSIGTKKELLTKLDK